MSVRKPIAIEPDSETAQLLKRVGDEPVSIISNGVRYRIEKESEDPFANYDPAKALEALRESAGALAHIDLESFKKEIREQRSQAPRPWET